MEKELRRLLLEFDLEDIQRMSKAEVKTRIEPLREIEDAPHLM